MIVPDGQPIVSFTRSAKVWVKRSWGDLEPVFITEPIPKDENIRDYPTYTYDFRISIDRTLDYKLPIYIEHQAQMRDEFGGEVIRTRYLVIVPRGSKDARGTTPPGDPEEVQKSLC